MQEDHPVIMYKEDFVSEDYGENQKIQNVIEIWPFPIYAMHMFNMYYPFS